MSTHGHEQEVDQHETLFAKPLQLFKPTPFNDLFTENRTDVIHPVPNTPFADAYTFKRQGNNVGLIKTSDARMHAKISLRNAAAALVATANFTPPPFPLRTMWRSAELKINECLITPATNFNHLAAYLKILTRETPKMYKDSPQINCGYFDTHGEMNTVLGNNVGSVNRRNLTNNIAEVQLIDKIDLPCFSDSGGEVFIPSAFKLELKYVRAPYALLFMGADPAAVAFAAMRMSLEEFHIRVPVYKPKDQLSSALNTAFVTDSQEARYYSTTFRTVTSSIAALRRSHIENDVFNGSCPVRLFIVYLRRNNFAGTMGTNVFNFAWENYSNVNVTVNSVSIGTIENSVEAYEQLRHVLNRDHSEMPITYNQFINGYAVLAFDLTTNSDTHLKVLPNRPSGVVNVHMNFSADTPAGNIIYIGEFRNEIKVGMKTPARLLYDV